MNLKNFYKSRQWRNLVDVLRNERTNEDGEIICAYCGKPIQRKYDVIGHHIKRLTEDNVNDATISLNPENVELIHFSCHNKIHQRYEGFTQRVYLVYGSPCSGKSTWVQENAYEDDLIVDLDRIWESICFCSRDNKPNRLKANAFGIRDCLIDQIRTRKGMWRNAYLIGTYPLASDRERLCELLNAEEIFIESDLETCLKRAKDRENSEKWEQIITDWYSDYVPSPL